MKTKTIKFKYKKEKHEINVVIFETISEAHNTLGDEMLKTLNFANEELAKLSKMGINPFKPKKTKFRLDSTKLDAETLEMLKEKGAIEG